MATSEQLLNEFARTRSEDAFREIVERHLNLVFATATRIGHGDSHFARDVAQVVFRDLALKGNRFPPGTLVSGWLYRHTSFTAKKMLRSERRRVAREQSSLSLQSMNGPDDLSDRLDPALEKLGHEDRTVIVLRFLEALNLRQLGDALGISEDAAQKRVSRALEKLRTILGRQGATITTSVLATALSAQVFSAPSGLPATLARVTLESLTLSTASTMINLFSTLKAKTALLALIALGVATPLLLQHRNITQLKAERAALTGTIKELHAQIDHASNAFPAEELARLRRENAALHKLRADFDALKQQMHELENTKNSQVAPDVADPNLQTPPQVRIIARYVETPPAILHALFLRGISVPHSPYAVILLSNENKLEAEEILNQQEGVEFLTAPAVTTLDRRAARVPIGNTIMIQDKSYLDGTTLEVIPEVSPDRQSTTLKITGTYSEYLGVIGNDGVPLFRTSQVQIEGQVSESETLLMQARTPGTREEGPRTLLVFITSTILNSDRTAAAHPHR